MWLLALVSWDNVLYLPRSAAQCATCVECRTAHGGGGMVSSASGVALWHTSRATGVVSVVLFSVVIVLGVLVNQKGRLAGLPRFGATGLHRHMGLLAVVFVPVHAATPVAGRFGSISRAPGLRAFVPVSTPGGLGA